MKTRCINIDWLECYCLEDYIGYPHNAEYFRRMGYVVREREYGTPMYHEMFTIYGHDDLPFLEIRRRPKSSFERQENGLFDPMSCHVRLSNRTCYFETAAQVMQLFLEEHHLSFQRIMRIDICLDFELFDTRDNPQQFLQRYFAGKYAKINQANVAARARDHWDKRKWNSVSWGSKNSMVSTKFYNKTLELKEVKDKPYIRQAWLHAGLVDDVQELWKIGENSTKYQPDIWRLEFSIKSGRKKWYVIEDFKTDKRKLRSVHHTLSDYFTRQQLLDRFFSLADHYFHFKHVEYIERRGVINAAMNDSISYGNDNRKLQRKDRCADKVLFYPKEQSAFYRIEHVASDTPKDRIFDNLLERIKHYQETHVTPEIYNACNVLIEQMEKERRLLDIARPWPTDELTAIRLLIAERMNNHNKQANTSLSEIKAMINLQHDLFGEVDCKK